MKLIEKAAEVQKKAYAPYSKFRVGSAVVGESGKIYVGCNVENSSYPAAICAERVAITQAIAQGEKFIKELAIVASSDKPVMPCGICLQVISEFASPDLEITLSSNDQSKVQVLKLKELLPHAFDKSFLK
jgi:cytidine deaminase